MTTLLTSFALTLLMLHSSTSMPTTSIPLAGPWQFALDPKGASAVQGEAGRTYHRLGAIFELKVGPGKLLVCAVDLLDPALKSSPEAAQLLTSLVQYAGSPQFQPATEVTPDTLQSLLGKPKLADNGSNLP